jgi:hypothetical protein
MRDASSGDPTEFAVKRNRIAARGATRFFIPISSEVYSIREW